MDVSAQAREFLMSRRAKVTPAMVGLPPGGGQRRVPGLRREEVATLAGLSVDYYTQIERGDIAGASDEVLEAIASALLLDEIEVDHLFSLVRAGNRRKSGRQRRPALPDNAQRIIDSMTDLPVIVQNGRLDILASNPLGRALFTEVYEFGEETEAAEPPNYAKFIFLSERAGRMYPEWDTVAEDVANSLRRELVRQSNSPTFAALIGELSTRSEYFRELWAAQDVSAYRSGRKTVRHPVVGELDLDYEVLTFPGIQNLSLVTYLPHVGAEADSGSDQRSTAEALRFLASWSFDGAASEDASSTAKSTSGPAPADAPAPGDPAASARGDSGVGRGPLPESGTRD